jgi:tetratricopeptide (TPR) repeat protein
LFLLSTQRPHALHCPDGDHFQIDISQVAIQYDGSALKGTLSGLSVLQFEVTPARLQEAAVATQQWDVFLRGLTAGYNNCVITGQQYAEGLQRIYPSLKEETASLEEIRKERLDGHRVDQGQFQNLLNSYYDNLSQFAQVSDNKAILSKLEGLSQQETADAESIVARFNNLERKNAQAPLSTPTEVGTAISQTRQILLANADQAEKAYNKAYALLNEYRFNQAIPYLREALAAVPLPEFYFALGRAYLESSELEPAEKVLKEGLVLVTAKNDEKNESQLAGELALVLAERGCSQDLSEGLTYARRALQLDEKLYGSDNREVAADAENIGIILQAQRNFDDALRYARRALTISESLYGPDDPEVAVHANNIGAILQARDAQGDLDAALGYAQRALKIEEKVYGPDTADVATIASNIGAMLQKRRSTGDLDEALRYTRRAMNIDEKLYGLDHPKVATMANNIGAILLTRGFKGDLDEALAYAQRALKIGEKTYGPNHLSVANAAQTTSRILREKGDLDGALSYAERALRIVETNRSGPNDPLRMSVNTNIKRIKEANEQKLRSSGHHGRSDLPPNHALRPS